MLKGTRRRKAVAVITTVLVSVAALALAQWLSDAIGPGAGRVGSLQPITFVNGTLAENQRINPGSTGDAVIHVTNPNATAVRILEVQDVQPSGLTYLGGGSPDMTLAMLEAAVSVNAHVYATPISVAPGEADLVLPDAFRVAANADERTFNAIFTRQVKLIVGA